MSSLRSSVFSTAALTLALPLLVAAAPAPALAAAPASVGSNLVVNGGFEATVLKPGTWVNVPTISGWTWVAGPGTGFEVRNNVSGAAYEGSNFLELASHGDSSIAQSFASLAAGQQYTLSFFYSPRPNTNALTNGLAVYWNGVQLGGDLNGAGASTHQWTSQQFSVLAGPGSNVLSFRSFGGNDSLGASLDGVSLVSSVPEPASAWLLAVGLGTIALKSRRRTA